MIKPVSKNGSGVSKSTVSKWSKMIESFQDKSFIKPSKKEAFAQMLENEMRVLPNVLKENISSTGSFLTSGGNSALGTVPFYIGVIRRGFPKLVGMNLMGVQPLSQPGGVLFAVQRTYKGSQADTTAGSIDRNVNKFNSRIIVTDGTGTFAIGGAYAVSTSGSVTAVTVIYKEDNLLLVRATAGATEFVSGESVTDITDNEGVPVVAPVSATLDNFAVYSQIFKNYSTFKDDSLGINNNEFDGSQIREVGKDIVSVPITNIQNRRIRSKISQEVIEDMQAYKYDVQNDLMNTMLEDITSEMNREFYGKLKGSAEDFGTFAFSSFDGNNNLEKYISIISKTTSISNQIAVDLKNAVGNYMVVSPSILSAFQTLSKYWNYTNDPSVGNIQLKAGNFATDPYVGKFNGNWDMYIDIFDESDSIMVGHYSDNNLDNAYYYLPYIPLTPDVLKDPETGQWVLHYRTRYATLENPFGANLWLKKFNISGFTV
jgi:hypothetical protein